MYHLPPGGGKEGGEMGWRILGRIIWLSGGTGEGSVVANSYKVGTFENCLPVCCPIILSLMKV